MVQDVLFLALMKGFTAGMIARELRLRPAVVRMILAMPRPEDPDYAHACDRLAPRDLNKPRCDRKGRTSKRWPSIHGILRGTVERDADGDALRDGKGIVRWSWDHPVADSEIHRAAVVREHPSRRPRF